jgi:transcriptional regulator with XRE-family HTH domain
MAPRPAPPRLARQLGNRIRALRLEANVTQEQLAWACNLNKGYMSRVESGKQIPSVPVLATMARELGVELTDLFAFDQTKPRARLVDAVRRGDADGVRRALHRLGFAP